jgi:hypothetical protein
MIRLAWLRIRPRDAKQSLLADGAPKARFGKASRIGVREREAAIREASGAVRAIPPVKRRSRQLEQTGPATWMKRLPGDVLPSGDWLGRARVATSGGSMGQFPKRGGLARAPRPTTCATTAPRRRRSMAVFRTILEYQLD